MKRLKLLGALFVLFFNSSLSAQGIRFEEGSFEEALTKAESEQKLLFLEVFTDWCAPCKLMAKNYFPTKEAGDFYNKHFVNFRIDAEKGEGIDVAKKYGVTGYPTVLFLKGKNGQVVYRVSGMPSQLKNFIEFGEIALLENQDTLTIHQYDSIYNAGQYDQKFLEKYLAKNKKININNDLILEQYIKKFVKKPVTNAQLIFIRKYQDGVLTEGYEILADNSEKLNAHFQDTDFWPNYKSNAFGKTINRLTQEKDREKFEKLIEKYKDFGQTQSNKHYYQKEFYTAINDLAMLKKVNENYADYLMHLTDSELNKLNEDMAANMKASIVWQVDRMGYTGDSAQKIIDMNLNLPRVKYAAQSIYARNLNELAWKVYEQTKNNSSIPKSEIKQAASWAQKAMIWSKPFDEQYIAIADTYAHLLFTQGKTDEAIKIQKEAIDLGKKINFPGLEDYEAFLNTMMQ